MDFLEFGYLNQCRTAYKACSFNQGDTFDRFVVAAMVSSSYVGCIKPTVKVVNASTSPTISDGIGYIGHYLCGQLNS